MEVYLKSSVATRAYGVLGPGLVNLNDNKFAQSLINTKTALSKSDYEKLAKQREINDVKDKKRHALIRDKERAQSARSVSEQQSSQIMADLDTAEARVKTYESIVREMGSSDAATGKEELKQALDHKNFLQKKYAAARKVVETAVKKLKNSEKAIQDFEGKAAPTSGLSKNNPTQQTRQTGQGSAKPGLHDDKQPATGNLQQPKTTAGSQGNTTANSGAITK